MKKIRSFIIICLLLSAGFSPGKAQLLFGLTPVEFTGLPDTVQYGDTIQNLQVKVVNDGLLSIVNQLLGIEGYTNTPSNTSLLGSLLIPLFNPLLPGDTVTVPLDMFIVTTQNSNQGANIMVIWPNSPNTEPTDSMHKDYYVIGDSEEVSRAEPKTPAIKVYPNPVKDQIRLDYSELGSPAELPDEIRLYAQNGTLVMRLDSAAATVNVARLPRGVYFIELRKEGDPLLTKRFIKQ